MKPVDSSVVQRFAKAFCYGRTGFSLEQIPDYFSAFEGSVFRPKQLSCRSRKVLNF